MQCIVLVVVNKLSDTQQTMHIVNALLSYAVLQHLRMEHLLI